MLQFTYLKSIGPLMLYIFFICYSFTMLYYLLYKLSICREGDVFLLNCRIYTYLFYFVAYSLLSKQIYALFEDLFHSLLANTFTKMYKITRVKRIIILKVNLPTKVLTIWTVNIPLHNSL